MFDVLKKTFLTGVGLTLMTADKVEEVAREIANAAQLSADKGQEFIEEAVSRAKKGREELEATVQRLVSENLKKTPVATREDIDRLVAKIEQLEQRLESHAE